MAYKNKLILGTNKDTFIAADDTGDIVFVNEKGSEAKLTENGLVVKPLGSTDFSEVGAGAGAAAAATPIVAPFNDTIAPSAKLIHPDGSETPVKVSVFNGGNVRFNRGVSSGNGQNEPKYMIDWTSKLQEEAFEPSFADAFFNLPAIAWNVESTLEVDFKNAPCNIYIDGMDFYDPNYQNFSGIDPLISSVVCKNSPIVFPGDGLRGMSSFHPMSPVHLNVGNDDYRNGLEVTMDSESLLYPLLGYSYSSNKLKITGLDWVEKLVAAQGLEINANNLKPEQDGISFDFSKLESVPSLNMYATSFFDPYDPNADPYAPPISYNVSAWNPNGIISNNISIFNIGIPDFNFPYIGRRGSGYISTAMSVQQSPGANETTWLNFLQALERTANAIGTSYPGLRGTWSSNGYTPNPDFYSTNAADVLYYELINRGVSFDIA